jgi:iron complex transport system substrate-binding protein
LLLALVLAACAGNDGGGSASPAEASAGAADEAFPVTIETDGGAVVIDEQPARIVSLSPTATETLFAIGANDQVIAVDDQSSYPAGAPVSDLSGFTPNVEAIAGYEPDLVVAGFDPGGLREGLEQVGVTVLLQPAAADLSQAYEQIEQLGAATGHSEEAGELLQSMRTRIDELADSLPREADGLTVYHEISPDFFSATSATFIGSIYELLGLTNIADEAGAEAPDYPQLSAEYIVSADPDLIVLSDTKCCDQTADTVAARPGWDGITAVSQGSVVEVDDDIASRWGPRTVEFVETVAAAVSGIVE